MSCFREITSQERMADFDEDFFPERQSFKLSCTISDTADPEYVYLCDKSLFQLSDYRTIKTMNDDPGLAGHFKIVEAEGGLCRIQSAMLPNFFVYQRYNGSVGAYNYGYDVSDEALFEISKQENGMVTLLNIKWNSNKFLKLESWAGFKSASFSKKVGTWQVHAVSLTDQTQKRASTPQSTTQALQPKRPLPRTQMLKTSEIHAYDVIKYEEPRGGIENIENYGPKAFANAKTLIQGCIFGAIENTGANSTYIQPKLIAERDNVTLVRQADISEGVLYYNMQLKVAENTVGNAIVEMGPFFGSRRIQRALCDSVLLQCVVRLSRQEKLPFIVTA